MARRMMLLFGTVAAIAAATAQVNACGDKFLRLGRSPRPNAYAAVHRAAILLYVPGAKAGDVKEYESFLKRAGHRPAAVRDAAALSSALASEDYDIVITPVAQAGQLRDVLVSRRTAPELLPIVPDARKQAEARYAHVLHAGGTKYDALAEIDRVMAIRLGANP
jgi:hypothetical protein